MSEGLGALFFSGFFDVVIIFCGRPKAFSHKPQWPRCRNTPQLHSAVQTPTESIALAGAALVPPSCHKPAHTQPAGFLPGGLTHANITHLQSREESQTESIAINETFMRFQGTANHAKSIPSLAPFKTSHKHHYTDNAWAISARADDTFFCIFCVFVTSTLIYRGDGGPHLTQISMSVDIDLSDLPTFENSWSRHNDFRDSHKGKARKLETHFLIDYPVTGHLKNMAFQL